MDPDFPDDKEPIPGSFKQGLGLPGDDYEPGLGLFAIARRTFGVIGALCALAFIVFIALSGSMMMWIGALELVSGGTCQ